METRTLALLFFCGASPGFCQQIVGADACSGCHASIFEQHRESPHALALRPILATDLPRLLEASAIQERNGPSFHYVERATGLEITVSKADSTEPMQDARGLLEWVFGGGSLGRTPVGRIAGRWFEHRVSHYKRPDKLAITLGHPLEPPQRAAAAVGRRLSDTEALRCFNCHATGVRSGFNGPDLSRMTPGVQCERCHGSGARHVQAAQRGDPAKARATIDGRRAPAADTLAFCGQCHRSGEQDLVPDDPLNVRFQPIGLARSLCFQRSGSLTCTSCHDPHQGAQQDAARYSAVCAQCHPATNAPAGCGRAETATKSCLPCHMSRRQPTAYLEFTDHHIRIVR